MIPLTMAYSAAGAVPPANVSQHNCKPPVIKMDEIVEVASEMSHGTKCHCDV
jgi:hypothetical protein